MFGKKNTRLICFCLREKMILVFLLLVGKEKEENFVFVSKRFLLLSPNWRVWEWLCKSMKTPIGHMIQSRTIEATYKSLIEGPPSEIERVFLLSKIYVSFFKRGEVVLATKNCRPFPGLSLLLLELPFYQCLGIFSGWNWGRGQKSNQKGKAKNQF